ncbi:MAG TPA: tetratricopeptide repeat protein, partial [Acidimicrobiales bacterium]|nr:tetratricopeptide repeat protein [Acidimicrobiales bacterium]
RRGWVLPTLAVAAVMGVALGRFALAGGDSAPPAPVRAAGGGAQVAISDLQTRLGATPDDPGLLTRLGEAYLLRARETADPSWFTKAGQALERSQALAPDRPATLTGLGLLALSRHEFSAALDLGLRAHELDPASAQPLGVVVDAQVELGRYHEATETAQKMLDRRPSLASLSRASYLRELHGDVPGAITAMTQAAIAGAGSAAADVAYVETLLGDLHLGAGALPEAEGAYRRALGRADSPAAEVGLARVAGARGDLAGAAVLLEEATGRLPQPAWLALLGDVYAALDRPADAAAQYDLVRRVEDLNRANGVAVDLELARFEADHARDPGADAPGAVAMARAALASRPTIFGEDTLAWALRQAGQPAEALVHAQAAVRLGTADALLWYHLAAIEADLGRLDDARTHLTRAVSLNPHLSVRDLPEARDLAARLGVSA